MKKALALGLILLMVLSGLVFAEGKNPNFKVAVHVQASSITKSCTKGFPRITGCQDIVTTYPGIDVHFFPVFFNLVEYQGVEYGVCWTGSDCVYTSCSDLTIGDIVHPCIDGISHAWFNCKPYSVCMPGYGWIYSYEYIWVRSHPVAGGPNIADCTPEMNFPPICNFKAGTNRFMGDEPCQETPTEESTWGSIKAMFR